MDFWSFYKSLFADMITSVPCDASVFKIRARYYTVNIKFRPDKFKVLLEIQTDSDPFASGVLEESEEGAAFRRSGGENFFPRRNLRFSAGSRISGFLR